ncbi:MAG: hypothetical protein AB8F94_10240 [Saprospiraceae bacterium]
MNYLKVFGFLFLGLFFMNNFNQEDEVSNLSINQEEIVSETNANYTPIIDSYEFLKEDKFCWRETYGRGVGSIPTICQNGMQMDAGLCYKLCKTGYYGIGPICYKSGVPDGFRDDGLYLAKSAPYGRGGGYPWLIGDPPFKNTGQMTRCEKDHGKGNCEQDGALVYPKCKENHVKQGCCICSPECPPGYQDIGVSCKKPSYGRGVGVVPTGCANGGQYNAGLCYQKCKNNYVGIGPVCWEVTCPNVSGKQWIDCGAGCAKTGGDCATAIIDMATTPLIAILNIAGMIVTGGGSGAATAGTGAAVTATTTTGKVIKYTNKAIQGGVKISKAIIENDLIGKAQQLLNGKPMPAHQRKGIKEYASMAYDASRTTTFDWRDFTSIDPTGLANVAAAYANPLCRDVKSNTRSTTTSTSTPPANNMAPASTGYVRIQNNWKKQNYLHNQNGKIEDGAIQPNWWSSQWKIVPAQGGYVRIQNKWKPSNHLHNQNGKIEDGAIQPNWWSAQWKIVPASNGWVRIQNKWKPTHYIHNQNGKIEVGPIDNNWASAMWKVQ